MDNRTKVLVVDDDRRMVRTICDILEINGFETERAYSGEEALTKVGASAPDCVLMDVKMEGIGGVEAAEIMKTSKPDLPVILMSAYTTEAQIGAAKRRGAYAVLTKPVDMQMVVTFLSLLRKESSVLIVNKDPLASEALRITLEARGCSVASAPSPSDVLGHMEREYKLVVLLDLEVGEEAGSAVLETIRRRYPTKPVVLLTGQSGGQDSSAGKGLSAGVYTCLYKPCKCNELSGIIEEIRHKKLKVLLGEPFESGGKDG